MKEILAKIAQIEAALEALNAKAAEELQNAGAVAAETSTQMLAIGEQQREIAERLLQLEQAGPAGAPAAKGAPSFGAQLVASDQAQAFIAGQTGKARFEIQANNITGDDTTVAPDRKPGVVPGESDFLTMESVFDSIPTTSNAIEYVREASFTNSAAEAAEAAAKAESALTFSLINMPISTVAHWINISRQLAMDNAALAAYVDTRLTYGVNKRVDTQLVAGNGTAPNISGIADAGNFTAHGYTLAALNALGTSGVMNKFKLIRKVMADLWIAGYIPDRILLNPGDFATMDIEQFSGSSNVARFSVDSDGNQRLFGVPVTQGNGVVADTFYVGAFRQAGTIHNREGVAVEMTDSHASNFTANLITIRAERRLALTIERPAAIIGGDLTPA